MHISIKKVKLVDKPGSVVDNHSSGIEVTFDLMRPTRIPYGPYVQLRWIPIWSCSRWGLPYRPCYQERGALLPHHFTLTHCAKSINGRFLFCCTFRRLTSPRSYLAPRPMEPGLSSPSQRRSDCLTNFSRVNINKTFARMPQHPE